MMIAFTLVGLWILASVITGLLIGRGIKTLRGSEGELCKTLGPAASRQRRYLPETDRAAKHRRATAKTV